MGWLKDRLRSVVNRWAEEGIAIGLLTAAYFLWRHRDASITIDLEVPVWTFLLVVVAAAVVVLLLSRRLVSRSYADEVETLRTEVEILADLVELGEYYALHLYDALESLQKVVRGTIPNVTPAAFIENGVLQPAREFLQHPGEDVRLSILVPDEGFWRMQFAAGYRLESRQRFRMSIDASFSRHAYQSGEIQWSNDLPSDSRFIRHPLASRNYFSLISMPIRSGDEVVGVLNVDSTEPEAFSQPDFIYVRLLGAIVGVVWSMVDPTSDEPPHVDEGTGGSEIGRSSL
ncbi:MAG TPA: GAF domain-containing protein [Gaiellaceae bacterium]|nr:GAF domain-containing protein [Gaiellaceae bacterium]